MTQNQKILRHLRLYGSIDPMTAIREYGIMRLGARIYDLKRDHNIVSIRKDGRNRFGEPCHWAVYYMNNKEQGDYNE